MIFSHRELHVILLDRYTKSKHGDSLIPILRYILLSRPVHNVHVLNLLFPNRELHTIVLDR
jgi:hypothetical protein